MSAADGLMDLMAAPLAAAAAVDPTEAQAAVADLEAAYPLHGAEGTALREALLAAVEDGSICDRQGKGDIRYSRLSRPDENDHGMSIDFVWMTGAGIDHIHPRGEINLCLAVEGDPRFDGHREGWVVFEPDSRHVPTVESGRMLIAYFLPGGAVVWPDAL